MERRQFIVICSTAIAAARLPATADTEAQMYGLIGKIKSVAGTSGTAKTATTHHCR